MFGIGMVIGLSRVLRAEARRARDSVMRNELPFQMYWEWRQKQDAIEAQERQEETAERRHRELISAIESVSTRY